MRRFAIAVGLFITVSTIGYSTALGGGSTGATGKFLVGYDSICTSNVNPHSDVVKLAEHEEMLELVPLAQVSSVAARSGVWSDPGIWLDGRVPEDGSRVLIPEDVGVTLDRELSGDDIDWLRVDGKLEFATGVPTAIRLKTLVVPPTGTLSIGAADNPVAATVTAKVTFLPRSEDDRVADPFDLGGGLIAHGQLNIVGAEKTAFLQAETRLSRGASTLAFASAPEGWNVGDTLLIAGVELDQNQDETFAIAAIDGATVTLDHPLEHDHLLVAGGQALPVANLTRNVVLSSAEPEVNKARGHVMVMHKEGGSLVEYAAFENLGRTMTKLSLTRPRLQADGTLLAGSDGNTIGRYALHFHTVSGASYERAPHLAKGNVIIHSPKHGLVSHGSYVVAEENVGYDNAGSHFFTENGSEIGIFRNNLAIRSTGSGAGMRARNATPDFGHGGHGFWLTSAAVEMSGNWAVGQAGGGIVLFGYPLREGTDFVYFDQANLRGDDRKTVKKVTLVHDVSFAMTNNFVVASDSGLEVWQHKLLSDTGAHSTVDGLFVEKVRRYGLFFPYARNIDLRHVVLSQPGDTARGVGVHVNDLSEEISFEDLDVRGFVYGINTPKRGPSTIRNARLYNLVNMKVVSATKPGRHLLLDRVAFEGRMTAAEGQPQPQNLVMEGFKVPINGDFGLLFKDDLVVWNEPGIAPRRLYAPEQAADFVPFDKLDNPQLAGLTGRQLRDEYGISVGGKLRPDDAVPFAFSNAYIDHDMAVDMGSAAAAELLTARNLVPLYDETTLTEKQAYAVRFRLQYPEAWQDFRAGEDVSHTGMAEQQWSLAAASANSPSSPVFVDNEAPTFLLWPTLRDLRIHPDDVAYGYRVRGMVYDRAGSRISVRAFAEDFFNLKVKDGYVDVSFDIHDMAGNVEPHTLHLKVDRNAVRRLDNLMWYAEDGKSYAAQYTQLNAEARELLGKDRALTVN